MPDLAYQHKSPRIFVILIPVLAYPALVTFGMYIDSYLSIYLSILSFLIFSTICLKNYLKIISLFILFYLSIGLLNISTWRGYTTIETLTLYAWSVYLLVTPLLLFARDKIFVPFQMVEHQSSIKLIIFLHLAISYISVLAVYVVIGNIFSNQNLRFEIPTSLEYTIKSVLPIAAVLPFIRFKMPVLLIIAIIIPSVMIGSRGTAIMGLLSYVIVNIHKNGGKINLGNLLTKNKTSIFYAACAAGILSVLFYVRRGGNNGFADVDVIMNYYFDYDNALVRMILPFYLGFKETIGLSTLIIMGQIQNTINPSPLLFADLYTVLPGEHLAAGQSLARIIGSTQEGGLTPGLLGGTYIDYGALGIIIFGIIGLCFAKLQRSIATSPYFIIIYAQIITQFIHLFHRGFFKPEYVTAVLISYFYYALCRRSKNARTAY